MSVWNAITAFGGSGPVRKIMRGPAIVVAISLTATVADAKIDKLQRTGRIQSSFIWLLDDILEVNTHEG